MRHAARALPFATIALALGCSSPTFQGFSRWCDDAAEPAPPAPPAAEEIESAIYERAHADRSEYFEREVERLRADLHQAEESIVELESGLRDLHTKADAVSAVAEARIALDRVQGTVPWRSERVGEAEHKLEEADRQLAADHLGAAVFFASRAQRITDSLREEADRVAKWHERRVIRGSRVNLRAAPSEEARVVQVLLRTTPVYPERTVGQWTLVRTPDGRVGWVFHSLLVDPRAASARSTPAARATED